MGLGQALGAFAQSLNNEDLMAMKRAEHEQVSALRDEQLKAAQRANDPELLKQKLEIDRMNAQTSRMQATAAYKNAEVNVNNAALKNKAFSALFGDAKAKQQRAMAVKAQTVQVAQAMGAQIPNTQEQVAQLSNELVATQQAHQDYVAVSETKNVATDYYTNLAEGQAPDIDKLNRWVGSDEVLSSIVKGPLQVFNPNDKAQMGALRADAAKLAGKKATEEDVELAFEGLKDLAQQGFILWDGTQTIDPSELLQITNATQTVPSALRDKASSRMESMTQRSAQKFMDKIGLRDVPEWANNADEDLTYNGMDLNKAAMMADVAGIKRPPELEAKIAKAKDLAKNPVDDYWKGASKQQIEQALDNQLIGISAAPDLDTAEELAARAKVGADLLNGDSVKKEKRQQIDNALKYVKAKSYVFENADDPYLEKEMEVQEMNYLDKDQSMRKTKETITGETNFVYEADSVMEDIIDAEKNGTPIISMLMGDTWASKAANVSQLKKSVESFVEGVEGKKMTTEEYTKRLEKTLGANTKLTKLVVDYLKVTSGSTVSEDENSRITGMLFGMLQGDTRNVLTTLSTFRDVVREKAQRKVKDSPLLVRALPVTSKRIMNLPEADILNRYDSAVAKRKQQAGGQQPQGQPAKKPKYDTEW